jgi:glutamine phosphoribosylpyrophosphate amidotransferase
MGDPEGRGFCFACFTGDYPVRVPQQLEMDKMAMERADAPAEASPALAQLT